MKQKKMYLKINLVSLVFIIVSFISVTLAWFAYSGLAEVATEVGVRAWYIELEKDGEKVSNDIVISLSEIYPGMDVLNEVINIKNMGDSDAQVKYSVVSARILGDEKDNYIIQEDIEKSKSVEDILSHEYPFHININLGKNYILAGGDETSFEVSISWPLDSDNDALDSLWGTNAYQFHQLEENLYKDDNNYQIRPSIQIVISVVAEQYLEVDTSSDIRYNLGDAILYNVSNNKLCSDITPSCLKAYVLDVNNSLGDEKVTLLLDPSNNYINGTYNDYNLLFTNLTNNWNALTRPLLVEDLLKVISTDITNSHLIIENLSNTIIGNLHYNNRMETEINKAIYYNGSYNFVNPKFSFLTADNCYWTNTNYNDNGFAVKKTGEIFSKIYGEHNLENCNIVPVIIADKNNLK